MKRATEIVRKGEICWQLFYGERFEDNNDFIKANVIEILGKCWRLCETYMTGIVKQKVEKRDTRKEDKLKYLIGI